MAAAEADEEEDVKVRQREHDDTRVEVDGRPVAEADSEDNDGSEVSARRREHAKDRSILLEEAVELIFVDCANVLLPPGRVEIRQSPSQGLVRLCERMWQMCT